MTWEKDAALAGQLERGHKPYLTMLAARCVEPLAKGQKLSENSDKATAKSFAERAGISDKTVTAYLRTWDAMAADGIVPPREELLPGVDVDLPSQDKWTDYYREANPPAQPKRAEEWAVEVTASIGRWLMGLEMAGLHLSEAQSQLTQSRWLEMLGNVPMTEETAALLMEYGADPDQPGIRQRVLDHWMTR